MNTPTFEDWRRVLLSCTALSVSCCHGDAANRPSPVLRLKQPRSPLTPLQLSRARCCSAWLAGPAGCGSTHVCSMSLIFWDRRPQACASHGNGKPSTTAGSPGPTQGLQLHPSRAREPSKHAQRPPWPSDSTSPQTSLISRGGHGSVLPSHLPPLATAGCIPRPCSSTSPEGHRLAPSTPREKGKG